MEIIEVKKDSKKIEISKNTIIGILAVALVLVSAAAICLAVSGEGHGERDGERGGMMGKYRQQGYDNTIDQEVELNDGMTPGNPATPAPATPVAPQTAPKAQ
jgi:hypothetical protein